MKGWKEITFLKWHYVTDRRVDETRGDQNDDGETKEILGFIGTGLLDPPYSIYVEDEWVHYRVHKSHF